MEFRKKIKLSYSLTVVGLALTAYVTISNYIRILMFRGGTFTRGAYAGGGSRGFGMTGIIGLIGVIIAITGAAWLGFTIAKQFKTYPKQQRSVKSTNDTRILEETATVRKPE